MPLCFVTEIMYERIYRKRVSNIPPGTVTDGGETGSDRVDNFFDFYMVNVNTLYVTIGAFSSSTSVCNSLLPDIVLP